MTLALAVAASFAWLATDTPGDRFGPSVALVAGLVWLAAMAARFWMTNRGWHGFGPLSFHPLYVVLLVTSCTYTLRAMHEADLQLVPNPDQPDFVPGLFTDLTVYYLCVLAGVVAFIALYGHTRGRALETAAVVQVVFLSPLYEPVLQLDIGAALLLGLTLVIAAFALAERRGDEALAPFRWTPFTLPMVAFCLAGLLVTTTAAYVEHSLVVLAKLIALTLLVVILAHVVRGRKHVWLVGGAVVLPVVGLSVVHLAKLVEIADHMGLEFAVRMRFTFFGLIGANTIGLAIAISVLLIIGGFFWTAHRWARLGLVALLVPLVPSLLSVRSSAGLVALAAGLLVLGAVAAKPDVLRAAAAYARRPIIIAGAIVALATVAAVVFAPNWYGDEWRDEISDPTTGRGVRSQLWQWSVEDIKHNPIVGVGLGDRRFDARTEHVPEFPFRDVTSLIERRLLLGGNGTEWRVFVWAQPHNIVLLVAESMGALGMLAFLWLIAALAWAGIALLRQPLTHERWPMAVALACIGGGLAWSFFALGQSVAYLPLPVWVALGLLAGAYCMAVPRGAGPGPGWLAGLRQATQRAVPLAMPFALVVLTLMFLGMVARPIAAETFARRANDARLEGDFATAIDEIRLARRLNPLHAGYADFLAQAYFRTGKESSEREALDRLLEIQPRTASNHARAAWTYFYQGDVDRALEAFERAVELDPWNSLGSNNVYSLALAYQFIGEKQKAVETFQQAFFIEPSLVNEGAWYPVNTADGPDMALDPAYSADITNARLQLLLKQRVYGLFTNADPPVFEGLTETLYLSDVLEDAYDDYRAERTRELDRAHGMLSAISRTYAAAGLHERATALARELSEDLPAESYVFYDLGLRYAALDRDAEARDAFDGALRNSEALSRYDIYRPFIHYRLGLLEERAGKDEAALVQFRAALDNYRWPYFPDAYRALARVAERTGREGEARDTLEKLRYLLGDDLYNELP